MLKWGNVNILQTFNKPITYNKRFIFGYLQSYWRGHKQRKVKEVWSKRIQEVRERVKNAKKNATEEKKLYRRTVSALDFLYTSKDMAFLIRVIRDLGKLF